MNKDIQNIIEDFDLLEDWEDKYAYLIDLGKKMPILKDEYKIEENKVRGCTSMVWLTYEVKSGRILLQADSDAHIVKGLIAILLKIYSGKTMSEIAKIDINYLFKKLNLEEYLSVSRSNGFFAIVERIKTIAASL